MMLGAIAGRRHGRGFTLVELMIVVAVICILAGLAIPGMLASRISANEASAIASLRVIGKAMETYRLRATGGTPAYPADFRDLGALIPRELDTVLSTGRKSGYAFKGGGVAPGFAVTATPIQFPNTGRRSFFINETGVVRSSENNGAEATAADSPI